MLYLAGNRLFRRNNIVHQILKRIDRCRHKNDSATEVKDEPIKYSSSKAGQWKAVYTSRGEHYHEMPRIQPFIVVCSLTAFMVYFCILREENDLDDWLRDIESHVPIQLEEAQLRVAIQEGKKSKKDISCQEARLQEIIKLKEKATQNN